MYFHYSPLQKLRIRLLLDQYGGWSGIRKSGKYDIERNVIVMPKLSPDREDRLAGWAVRNFHLLWRREKPRYRIAHEALRAARKPFFSKRTRKIK